MALPKGALYADSVALLERAGVRRQRRSPTRAASCIAAHGRLRVHHRAPHRHPRLRRVRRRRRRRSPARTCSSRRASTSPSCSTCGFGGCRFVVAEPEDGGRRGRASGCGTSACCASGRSTRASPRSYYARVGQQVEIVKLHGNIELAPLIGLVDRIVDITATGHDAARERTAHRRRGARLHGALRREPGVAADGARAREPRSPSGWRPCCRRPRGRARRMMMRRIDLARGQRLADDELARARRHRRRGARRGRAHHRRRARARRRGAARVHGDSSTTPSSTELRVTHDEIEARRGARLRGVRRGASSAAAASIEDFHRRQVPQSLVHHRRGRRLPRREGHAAAPRRHLRARAVARAIPSSVLMNAIPAVVAGVEEIAMVVPPRAGRHGRPARAVRGRRRSASTEIYQRRRRAGDRRARVRHRARSRASTRSPARATRTSPPRRSSSWATSASTCSRVPPRCSCSPTRPPSPRSSPST